MSFAKLPRLFPRHSQNAVLATTLTLCHVSAALPLRCVKTAPSPRPKLQNAPENDTLLLISLESIAPATQNLGRSLFGTNSSAATSSSSSGVGSPPCTTAKMWCFPQWRASSPTRLVHVGPLHQTFESLGSGHLVTVPEAGLQRSQVFVELRVCSVLRLLVDHHGHPSPQHSQRRRHLWGAIMCVAVVKSSP